MTFEKVASVDGIAVGSALHGSTFDLDTGAAESLPAVDPIPVYACEIEDGAVWVDGDQPLNDAPMPGEGRK